MLEKNGLLEIILQSPLLDILLQNKEGFNSFHEAVEMENILWVLIFGQDWSSFHYS